MDLTLVLEGRAEAKHLVACSSHYPLQNRIDGVVVAVPNLF